VTGFVGGGASLTGTAGTRALQSRGAAVCHYPEREDFTLLLGEVSHISAMPPNRYGHSGNFAIETSDVLPALTRRFHEAGPAGAGR